MYIFIIILHLFVSLLLIATILLQAGKGGGLSEAFTGVSPTKTIFGASATTFLTRATTACAILFIVTCLTLAVMSSMKSRSLVLSAPIPGAQTMPIGIPVASEGAAIDGAEDAAADIVNKTTSGEAVE